MAGREHHPPIFLTPVGNAPLLSALTLLLQGTVANHGSQNNADTQTKATARRTEPTSWRLSLDTMHAVEVVQLGVQQAPYERILRGYSRFNPRGPGPLPGAQD